MIFYLTDVDEDDCLSTEDIKKMINRIEKNFAKENLHITNESNALLNELAYNRATRRFNQTLHKLNESNLK